MLITDTASTFKWTDFAHFSVASEQPKSSAVLSDCSAHNSERFVLTHTAAPNSDPRKQHCPYHTQTRAVRFTITRWILTTGHTFLLWCIFFLHAYATGKKQLSQEDREHSDIIFIWHKNMRCSLSMPLAGPVLRQSAGLMTQRASSHRNDTSSHTRPHTF